MAYASVELSPKSRSRRRPEKVKLNRCPDCGAPMLLMAVTEAINHPITIRKTYQCVVCQSVEVMVAPLFE